MREEFAEWVWLFEYHFAECAKYFLVTVIVAVAVSIPFALLHTMAEKAVEKGYEQVDEKVQEDYTVYINGTEVDSSKIDIRLYSYSRISVDDEKKEIYIAVGSD